MKFDAAANYLLASLTVLLVSVSFLFLSPSTTFAGSGDIWKSCCIPVGTCDYDPGEMWCYGTSCYCCTATGWVSGTCPTSSSSTTTTTTIPPCSGLGQAACQARTATSKDCCWGNGPNPPASARCYARYEYCCHAAACAAGSTFCYHCPNDALDNYQCDPPNLNADGAGWLNNIAVYDSTNCFDKYTNPPYGAPDSTCSVNLGYCDSTCYCQITSTTTTRPTTSTTTSSSTTTSITTTTTIPSTTTTRPTTTTTIGPCSGLGQAACEARTATTKDCCWTGWWGQCFSIGELCCHNSACTSSDPIKQQSCYSCPNDALDNYYCDPTNPSADLAGWINNIAMYDSTNCNSVWTNTNPYGYSSSCLVTPGTCDPSCNCLTTSTTTTRPTTSTTTTRPTTTTTIPTTTTSSTTTIPLCDLTSASVSANCGGGASPYCEPGESVSMSGSYTGDCSAADFFQIDAAGSGCWVQYSGGDMSGVSDPTITVAGGSISGSWMVPGIASACYGKTVTATAAAIYDGGIFGTQLDIVYPPSASGSFRFMDLVSTTTSTTSPTSTTTTSLTTSTTTTSPTSTSSTTIQSTTTLPTSTTTTAPTEGIFIKYIKLEGTSSVLNVFWEAYYYPSSNSNLIATCYLNCPAPPCTAYKSCSLTYPGLEGEKSCSITEPDYHMTPGTLSPDSASTVTNLVNCVFTDTIRGRDTWQSLNFYPLAFYLNVPSAVSMTVGDQTPLEIEVKNLGILTDSYSFDLSSTEPTLLQVSRGQSTISNVPADNMDSKTADMFLLSTQQIVEAELAFSSMTAPEIKITPDKRIRVGGGMKSLPDFGLLGIVQIIAIAALLLFKLK